MPTTTTTTTDIKFSCASCGKEYRWKPELAGKQAKCKCGATITVPKTPPPPAVPKQAEVDLDGLYALAAEEKKASARLAADPEAATTQQGYRCPSCSTELPIGATVCPNCAMDLKTGRKRSAGGARSNGVAAAAAGFQTSKRGGGSGKQLSIKGGGKFNVVEPEGYTDINLVRDLYVPLGLIGLGVVLYFVQVRLAYGTEEADSFGHMFLMANLFADVVLLGVAMLICLKFISTSDSLPRSALKFVAVATAPTALAMIVEDYISRFNFRLAYIAGGAISLGLYSVLLKYLYNLNKDNISKVAVTIYIVRRWGKVLLFIGLAVVVVGMIVKKASDAAERGESGDDTEDVRPSSPQEAAKAADAEAEKMLKEDDFFEAREWLKADPQHKIYNLNEKSAATVESVYAMGATKVSVGVSADGAGGPIKAQLIVELPADPEQRAKIIEWATSAEKEFGGDEAETFKDVGQKYLAVNFHWD
jgi:hypothetical protein